MRSQPELWVKIFIYVSVTAATSASFNIDSLQFMLGMIHSLLTIGHVILAGF